LIRLAGRRHSSGLWCPPGAAELDSIGDRRLRAAGYSTAKAEALLRVSRLVVDGALPLEAQPGEPVDLVSVREALLSVRGIGPWTADYTLLRGFGWADGSLHGDAALRNALRALLGATERISAQQAERWLQPFAPWRSLVAAHLWAHHASVARTGSSE
jgi:DNA-3-methyladenine glycosylase II